jgi:hypothetical protein
MGLSPTYQRQEAQEVAEQELHPDFPVPDVLKSPAALLKLQADISRVTWPPHLGHATSSLPNTRVSKVSSHFGQWYS